LRARATEEILNAGYETHTHDDVGSPETIEMNKLQLSGRRVTPTAAAFETTTVDRSDVVSDAPVVGERTSSPVRSGEEIERVDTSGAEPQWAGPTPEATESDISAECIGPVPCPSPPSIGDILDFFGDALDSFADAVGAAAEDIADGIASTVEALPDVDKEDFAIQAGELIVDTTTAFLGLVDHLPDSMPDVSTRLSVVWNMKLFGIDSLYALATSGALAELNNGDTECGTCMSMFVIFKEAGLFLANYGAQIVCMILSPTVILGVACTVVVGTLLSLGVSAKQPDVEDMCSWHTSPTGLNYC